MLLEIGGQARIIRTILEYQRKWQKVLRKSKEDKNRKASKLILRCSPQPRLNKRYKQYNI